MSVIRRALLLVNHDLQILSDGPAFGGGAGRVVRDHAGGFPVAGQHDFQGVLPRPASKLSWNWEACSVVVELWHSGLYEGRIARRAGLGYGDIKGMLRSAGENPK